VINILTSSFSSFTAPPWRAKTPDDDIFASDGSMDEFQAPDYPEEDSDNGDAMDVVDEDEFGDTKAPDQAKRRKRKDHKAK